MDVGIADVAEHPGHQHQVRGHRPDVRGEITGVRVDDPDVGQVGGSGLDGGDVALVVLQQGGAYPVRVRAGGKDAQQVVALPRAGTDRSQRLALPFVEPSVDVVPDQPQPQPQPPRQRRVGVPRTACARPTSPS